MNLSEGSRIGHYEIIGVLGTGGMGEVYRARDTKLKREVALKLLPEHVAGHPDSLSRFEREAVVLAQLSHPNILAIHDFGNFDGLPVAVMELLEGETLREMIAHGQIPARRSLEISAEVADGLAAAHSKGIIHRDLKPENIFITQDNQVKILDFGLARIDGNGSVGGRSNQDLPTETEPGTIKGTIGYMSPEQLRGQPVDGRSDIFSLGCVLYEMLTGRRAFSKATVADTMTAILREDPPDFIESGRQVPPDAERVTEHCLEKDPDRRYQSVKDLSMHLRSLASSPQLDTASRARISERRFPWAWISALAVAAIIAAAGFFWVSDTPTRPAAGSRPSVAVLYFENNTGDSSLDWMRSALTNMLVTDLSQSIQIEVLSTDRLYQILKELDQLDEPTVSSRIVDKVAEKAQAGTVVLGSFMRAGETFRLDTRIQEAKSGRILATERVEGIGESSIFKMVDELTRRIKSALEVSPSESGMERELESVSTSSFEAYRNYIEAAELHARSKEREAIPYLEKAIKLDPKFAMAYAKLSVAHWNIGHVQQAHEYARRALDYVDRLPARERYYIEGRFYSLTPETLDRAVEAYETAISLFPDHSAARHNLANLYAEMERYEDAITQYEVLRKAGSPFAGTYTNLAAAYAAIGKEQEGYRVLSEFVEKYPENGAGYRDLAGYLIKGGHFDEALGYLKKAEVRSPGDLEIKLLEWNVYVFTRKWADADRVADAVASSSDLYWRSRSLEMKATRLLFEGRRQDARERFNEAAKLFPEDSLNRAQYLAQLGKVELISGNYKSALKNAELAYQSGRGFPIETDILALAAFSQSGLGHSQQAQSTFEELRPHYQNLPERIVDRTDNFILGTMALLSSHPAEAVARFDEAWATFPPNVRTLEQTNYYVTGLAFWETGRRPEGVKWFERLLNENYTERLANPIGYVRAHYFLGKYFLDEGDRGQARRYWSEFVDLWGGGSMDRDHVAEARKFLREAPEPAAKTP